MGLEDLEANRVKANVYPTLCEDELHVDLPADIQTAGITITLSDLQGVVCHRITECRQSNVINVSHLSGGIYMLNVTTGHASKTFKVVVK